MTAATASIAFATLQERVFGCRIPVTSDNLKALLLSVAATMTANNLPVSWPAVTITALWFRTETSTTRRLLVSPDPDETHACCAQRCAHRLCHMCICTRSDARCRSGSCDLPRPAVCFVILYVGAGSSHSWDKVIRHGSHAIVYSRTHIQSKLNPAIDDIEPHSLAP